MIAGSWLLIYLLGCIDSNDVHNQEWRVTYLSSRLGGYVQTQEMVKQNAAKYFQDWAALGSHKARLIWFLTMRALPNYLASQTLLKESVVRIWLRIGWRWTAYVMHGT